MQEEPIPPRRGESLGAYYWWSQDLLEALKRSNARQAQEREHYLNP